MIMPRRAFSSAAGYRYGFNGKENDSEVKGLGNEQDYGMRIYDPRVGRFLSVDPLTRNYPKLTPYQFASNTPLQAIDLDGKEAKFVYGYFDQERERAALQPTQWLVVQGQTHEKTFGNAAEYNTKNNNPAAYKGI